MTRTLFVPLLLVGCLTVPSSVKAQAGDPVIGNWTLDVAKSKVLVFVKH
jgi:hypothetical protein